MNPQAFPSSVQNLMNGSPLEEMKGMDLRDYFAAKALPEILAQKDVHRESERKNAAWIAYQIADDMLAARDGQ